MAINLINLCRKKIKEEYREEIHAGSLRKVFSIKTDFGWRSMDSLYDPVGEASAAVGELNVAETKAIVLGAGSGFIGIELLQSGITDILMITASNVLAINNIKVLSIHCEGQNKIDIIIATSVGENLISCVRKFAEGCADLRIVCHPRETKAFPHLFNPLSIFLQSLIFPISKEPYRSPIRVLFPNSASLFEPEIYSELIKRGCEVFSVESFVDSNISSRKAWDMICKYKPDLVLSTNNKAADMNGLIPDACSVAGIPWATWFTDEPRFIVSQKEMRKQQKRFAFCWDKAGVESSQHLGFQHVELLALATDTSRFTPGKGIESLNGKIVYVGSPSFGNEDRYFSSLKSDPVAELISRKFEGQLLKERKMPSEVDVTEAVRGLELEEDYFSSESLSRLPAYVLYRANQKYRIDAMTALADLNPIVYGDGWHGLLPDSIELRDYVDYYSNDLLNIYQSDAVHVSLTHLQMYFYPNQRIFDIGACGRIVLGDRLEGWGELFGNCFDDLVFDDFNNLRERAIELSGNQAKRKRLGCKLRSHILSQHTISHRIDRMLEYIKKAT